ncbi:hypothetical protein CCACVL1_10769 [Corchorus capsularis]|uniref:Uncharacterized protein n=1 Tax=Corchorus capsularis TaxID=210143 RepID=A0A1R3IPX0_COCAP|nr:hypothetical protein CCACVL1_10769 [Corchorus capsularis]
MNLAPEESSLESLTWSLDKVMWGVDSAADFGHE